ncbi:MAG: hypothetical protein ACLUMK_08345 [Christensenellales bacterium]
METISETRTTIERGQIAQKLESGYRVCPFAGSYVTAPIPALFGAAYDVGENVYFFYLTTEKARFWRRLTDGKGGRNHGGRAADA